MSKANKLEIIAEAFTCGRILVLTTCGDVFRPNHIGAYINPFKNNNRSYFAPVEWQDYMANDRIWKTKDGKEYFNE